MSDVSGAGPAGGVNPQDGGRDNVGETQAPKPSDPWQGLPYDPMAIKEQIHQALVVLLAKMKAHPLFDPSMAIAHIMGLVQQYGNAVVGVGSLTQAVSAKYVSAVGLLSTLMTDGKSINNLVKINDNNQDYSGSGKITVKHKFDPGALVYNVNKYTGQQNTSGPKVPVEEAIANTITYLTDDPMRQYQVGSDGKPIMKDGKKVANVAYNYFTANENNFGQYKQQVQSLNQYIGPLGVGSSAAKPAIPNFSKISWNSDGNFSPPIGSKDAWSYGMPPTPASGTHNFATFQRWHGGAWHFQVGAVANMHFEAHPESYKYYASVNNANQTAAHAHWTVATFLLNPAATGQYRLRWRNDHQASGNREWFQGFSYKATTPSGGQSWNSYQTTPPKQPNPEIATQMTNALGQVQQGFQATSSSLNAVLKSDITTFTAEQTTFNKFLLAMVTQNKAMVTAQVTR